MLKFRATDAWAVGPQFGTFTPEFQHWDGTSWSNVAVPAATDNFLQFSAASPSTLFAIGQNQILLSTNS